MALCVCKCLNIILECEKYEDNVNIGKLELTAAEQRDIFFNEKLLSTQLDKLKIQVAQSALVGQRNIGRWTLHFCLACKQTTHAILHDKNSFVLINKALKTTTENVNCLKKSSSFSPVFNLLVPEIANDENIDTNNLSDNKTWVPAQKVIGSLSKQLSQTLQSQLEAVEETVRQFRDQKYAEYEAYRERAQKDHKILASIVSKARSSVDSDGVKIDTTIDNGPPSPQLPPLQRRRLSSLKDAKKITQNIQKPPRNYPPEEDSLEAEDLFDLEGMESHNNMLSDLEDYESDPDFAEEADDEGIHVPRSRVGRNIEIAHSLPINMPNLPERHTRRDLDEYDEPQDIAASIKALARSVHGDVFELPRPRFTTQI